MVILTGIISPCNCRNIIIEKVEFLFLRSVNLSFQKACSQIGVFKHCSFNINY